MSLGGRLFCFISLYDWEEFLDEHKTFRTTGNMLFYGEDLWLHYGEDFRFVGETFRATLFCGKVWDAFGCMWDVFGCCF